jgi:hypothetical protein
MALRVVAGGHGEALVTPEKAEGCHSDLRKTLAVEALVALEKVEGCHPDLRKTPAAAKPRQPTRWR